MVVAICCIHQLLSMSICLFACRDIKPENVLFTSDRILKVADFGLAIDLTEEHAVTRAGTLGELHELIDKQMPGCCTPLLPASCILSQSIVMDGASAGRQHA